MKPYLVILGGLIKLAVLLLSHAQRKKDIEAGEAALAKRSLELSLRLMERVRNAKRKATIDFDARDGLPDHKDPNLRDAN